LLPLSRQRRANASAASCALPITECAWTADEYDHERRIETYFAMIGLALIVVVAWLCVK
jgi:hypothetical protein